MKNVLTVMRKEFARFFRDRRMILMVLLPAVLIYAVYSIMGSAIGNMIAPDEEHTPLVYAVNMPGPIMRMALEAGLEVEHIELREVEGAKGMISQKEVDLCVIFPLNFEEYFNSTDPNSNDTYWRVLAMLDAYEASLANKFDVNREMTPTGLQRRICQPLCFLQ
jgi:sodium transport system permease protein